MNIGLIGLPASGKTTVFNALTGHDVETGRYSDVNGEPNVAVVAVSDKRVDALSELYKPQKSTYATVEIIDYGGFSDRREARRREAFTPLSLNRMKGCNAFAIVVRNFDDPIVDAAQGPAKPEGDFSSVLEELLLADQLVAENRIARLEEDRAKGKSSTAHPREDQLLRRIAEALDDGKPVSALEFDAEAIRVISDFQFLSAKPVFVILNSDESRYSRSEIARLSFPVPIVEFAGQFEAELTGMDDDEAIEFMADAGITDSARSRLTTFAYEILGYISFFTVGEDEVRAWTIQRGESAVAAAGAIHSDLARGFIRAECFRCDDVLEHGTEKELKKLGKIRIEGKEYVVSDGDVLSIRFSV